MMAPYWLTRLALLKITATAIVCVCLPLAGGCSVTEIRSTWKGGPEFRHKGSDRTDSVRWSAQTGLKAHHEDKKGHEYTTAVTYRRRDVDDGAGDNDNGVWFEYSFPLWKAPKKHERDIVALQRRVARLEQLLADKSSFDETAAGGNAEAP